MNIYFMQHGLALDKTIDPERPLSEQGRVETLRMASFLAERNVVIQGIRHSGKLRAQQTAEIVAKTLNITSVEAIDGMGPNDDPAILIKQLEDDTLYIGHLPHLNRLISLLLCNDSEADVIQFTNSAIACLKQAENNYQLAWHLLPNLNFFK